MHGLVNFMHQMGYFSFLVATRRGVSGHFITFLLLRAPTDRLRSLCCSIQHAIFASLVIDHRLVAERLRRRHAASDRAPSNQKTLGRRNA